MNRIHDRYDYFILRKDVVSVPLEGKEHQLLAANGWITWEVNDDKTERIMTRTKRALPLSKILV